MNQGPEPAPPGAGASVGIPAEQWLDWRLLTGADIAALDRARTIVIGSVSPLEVHGPHLPVITDIAEAEGLLHAALVKVHQAHPDLIFVRLPPQWVAADVLPMHGSISFRPSTVQRVVRDLGDSLARQGFSRVWLSNFHGGPRHFLAIEHALNAVNRRNGTQMLSVFSLLLARLTEGGSHELDGVLGELDGVDSPSLTGDIHGGYIETSMMLHLVGDFVRDHTGLPPVTLESWRQGLGKRGTPANPVAAFRDSYRFFHANSYAGSPAKASAELGARFIDTLAEHTANALGQVLDGELSHTDARSPLFRWRRVLLNPALGRAFERWARP